MNLSDHVKFLEEIAVLDNTKALQCREIIHTLEHVNRLMYDMKCVGVLVEMSAQDFKKWEEFKLYKEFVLMKNT